MAHAWKFMPCKGTCMEIYGTCMEIYALQGHMHGNLWHMHGNLWEIYGTCMEIYALQGHVHGNLWHMHGNLWEIYGACMEIYAFKGTCMEIYALQGRSYHWGNCLSKSFSPSIACNSLDFLNLLYHAIVIDMLKFSHGSASVKKYTLATHLPCGREEGRPHYNSENAKVNEGIAGASQSFSRAALKGVCSTATIRPVMMHLLI